jgi:hypothetical protein
MTALHARPQSIIVEAGDLMREFQQNTEVELNPLDVEQILLDVVNSLLLADREYQGQLESGLNFNGMRSPAFYKTADAKMKIQRAALILEKQLHARLSEFGVFEDGEFPYFFDRFVSFGDIQLRRLPH